MIPSLKEIIESPKELKAIFLLLLVIPFWYVAIHFTSPHFFANNSFTTIIIYSIVCAFSIAFLNITIGVNSILFNKRNIDFISISISEIAFQILVICTFLLANLLMKYIYDAEKINIEIILFTFFLGAIGSLVKNSIWLLIKKI